MNNICKEIGNFMSELTCKPTGLDDIKLSINEFCDLNKKKPMVLITVCIQFFNKKIYYN